LDLADIVSHDRGIVGQHHGANARAGAFQRSLHFRQSKAVGGADIDDGAQRSVELLDALERHEHGAG
jgi:hypothetical protein